MTSPNSVLPGVPLVESPLFPSLVESLGFDEETKRIALDLHSTGYAVIQFPDPDFRMSGTPVPVFGGLRRTRKFKTCFQTVTGGAIFPMMYSAQCPGLVKSAHLNCRPTLIRTCTWPPIPTSKPRES